MKNNYSDTVRAKFLSVIDEYKMLQPAESVVVGFSGGADSVCLLSLFYEFKKQLGIEKIVAAHINHGIRGQEALRDALFAEDFCKTRNIEFKLLNADCINQAKLNGETVEECGRRIRYAFFDSLCTENFKIATAHNANDNVETIIFNLARGTSLKGACGIPQVRDNIIRPLIRCSRKEIEGYCFENNLTFVTDSTNLCDDYTRNKIRHTVLPVLEDINPNFADAFASFSSSCADTEYYIKAQAKQAVLAAKKGKGTYDGALISQLPGAVAKEAIVQIFAEISEKTLDCKKINAVYGLLKNGGRYQVFGEIFAEMQKGNFRFYKENRESNQAVVNVDNLPFETSFGDYFITLSKYTNSSKKIHHLVLDNLIDCDKINGKIFIRTRRSGDNFTFYNRKVTKTLKKLFNETAVPVEKRSSVPVICDDTGVVWVYGFGTNARCRVTAESFDIITVGGKDNDR